MKDNYHILVLDDDNNQRELLKSYLELAGPYWVDTTGRAEVFWPMLDENSYDLVFLDYKLPGTNGLEILSGMSNRSIHPPVIMMTGEGDERIAAQAIQRGAVDYIVKGNDILAGLPTLIQKAINVHELKQSFEQSLEQIRYQSMVLDNVRDAVVVWDLTGKITYWNPAAHVLFGWSADERIGTSVHETYLNAFNPPIYVPKIDDSSGFVLEREYTTKDNRNIWISSRLTPLRNEKNTRQLIGYMDVSRDVTQRKMEQQALKESQRFVQKIVDTTPNLLYIFDLSKRACVFCNRETIAILGMTPVEVQNLTEPEMVGLVHPDDSEIVLDSLNVIQKLSDGQICEIECRLKDSNGKWHWLLSRNVVFWRSPQGKAEQIIGVAQDITARKHAEEHLERQAEIETLIAQISANFLNMKPDFVDAGIRDALEAVSRLANSGYSCVYLQREDTTGFYPAASWSSAETGDGFINDHLHTYFQQSDSWLKEQIRQRDYYAITKVRDLPEEAGELRQHFADVGVKSVVFIPLIYANHFIGFVGFACLDQERIWPKEDIGMIKTIGNIFVNALIQKRSEKALRDSESRYRAIVEDHQTEMIFRFLPDSKITFVNENFCKEFRRIRSDLVGSCFLELIPIRAHTPIREGLKTLRVDRPVVTIEIPAKLPGGVDHWHEWNIRAIFDDGGQTTEYQAVGRDITERKHMEAQIKQAQTKLTEATRMVAIGELAAGVAHQINNPLTTIIAEAQILKHKSNGDSDRCESAEAIEAAGWRAQRVVQELMKFSEPPAGDSGPVDINQTIETALTLVGADIEARGIELSTQLAPSLPVLRGNLRQLEDLWINLLLVARSYQSEQDHPVISIHSYVDHKEVVIVEFKVIGISIPKEKLDRIFEPSLIPTSNRTITGMELSICREISRQNQAEIIAFSSVKGTTFQVKFLREVPDAPDKHTGD